MSRQATIVKYIWLLTLKIKTKKTKNSKLEKRDQDFFNIQKSIIIITEK